MPNPIELTLRGDQAAVTPPRITNANPRTPDNNRENLLAALDRLHTLWSIDNNSFDKQHAYIAALPPHAQVPLIDSTTSPSWSLQATFDAIQRNAEPTLSAPVINHFLGGLALKGGVGQNLQNNVDDVLRLQERLKFRLPYSGYAQEHSVAQTVVTASVPDASLTYTFGAIVQLKQDIASAFAGWLPVRAAEMEFGGDLFAGQTTSVSLRVKANLTATGRNASPPETDEDIAVSVFLPSKLASDANNVFLFYSANGATEDNPSRPGTNSTNVHALRSGADPTSWIVIGIPGRDPGWNTIDTNAILACLERAGRKPAIDKLRLCAHSRGIRGLQRTIQEGRVDLQLVDKIFILDQTDADLLVKPSSVFPRAARRRPTIVSYAKVFKSPKDWQPDAGTTLNGFAMLALSFARLIQDRPDVSLPPAAAVFLLPKVVPSLKPLGTFTTKSGSAVGAKTSIHQWTRENAVEIEKISKVDREAEDEWKRFTSRDQIMFPLKLPLVAKSPYFHVHTQNLWRFYAGPLVDGSGKLTANFNSQSDFGLEIYAHHLFVAEIAHELFE